MEAQGVASERVQRQIDRLLDEIEQASESEDWETVRNRARRPLAFDPENADAQGAWPPPIGHWIREVPL